LIQPKPISNNVLGKVDWFQIVIQGLAWTTVYTDLLQISLDCVTVEDATLKHEDYDVMYTCGPIRYYTYENQSKQLERGTLVMSGQACTMYEWANLAENSQRNVFQELALRIIDLASSSSMSFDVKRLDLALDDYNEKTFFDIDLIIGKVSRKQFLSKGRTNTVYDSEFDKRTRSKTQVIGARGSECMFRIYEKGKELAMGLSGVEREVMLKQAPQIRLEAETRKDTANDLFITIAYLTKKETLTNLIRGFVSTELNFYSDTTYRVISRWWSDYLKPSYIPNVHRRYEKSIFEDTLHWFEVQGPYAVTQALFFLSNNGIEILANNAIELPPPLLGQRDDYCWNQDLANKLIDFVTKEKRMDLIPLIHQRTKKPSTPYK